MSWRPPPGLSNPYTTPHPNPQQTNLYRQQHQQYGQQPHGQQHPHHQQHSHQIQQQWNHYGQHQQQGARESRRQDHQPPSTVHQQVHSRGAVIRSEVPPHLPHVHHDSPRLSNQYGQNRGGIPVSPFCSPHAGSNVAACPNPMQHVHHDSSRLSNQHGQHRGGIPVSPFCSPHAGSYVAACPNPMQLVHHDSPRFSNQHRGRIPVSPFCSPHAGSNVCPNPMPPYHSSPNPYNNQGSFCLPYVSPSSSHTDPTRFSGFHPDSSLLSPASRPVVFPSDDLYGKQDLQRGVSDPSQNENLVSQRGPHANQHLHQPTFRPAPSGEVRTKGTKHQTSLVKTGQTQSFQHQDHELSALAFQHQQQIQQRLHPQRQDQHYPPKRLNSPEEELQQQQQREQYLAEQGQGHMHAGLSEHSQHIQQQNIRALLAHKGGNSRGYELQDNRPDASSSIFRDPLSEAKAPPLSKDVTGSRSRGSRKQKCGGNNGHLGTNPVGAPNTKKKDKSKDTEFQKGELQAKMRQYIRNKFPEMHHQPCTVPPLRILTFLNYRQTDKLSINSHDVREQVMMQDAALLGYRTEDTITGWVAGVMEMLDEPIFHLSNYQFDDYLFHLRQRSRCNLSDDNTIRSVSQTNSPDMKTKDPLLQKQSSNSSDTTSPTDTAPKLCQARILPESTNIPKSFAQQLPETNHLSEHNIVDACSSIQAVVSKKSPSSQCLFPTPRDLSSNLNRGDFDNLIISRYRLVVIESKTMRGSEAENGGKQTDASGSELIHKNPEITEQGSELSVQEKPSQLETSSEREDPETGENSNTSKRGTTFYPSDHETNAQKNLKTAEYPMESSTRNYKADASSEKNNTHPEDSRSIESQSKDYLCKQSQTNDLHSTEYQCKDSQPKVLQSQSEAQTHSTEYQFKDPQYKDLQSQSKEQQAQEEFQVADSPNAMLPSSPSSIKSNSSTGNQDEAFRGTIRKSLGQLQKAETVLRHMTSDLVTDPPITKVLALPHTSAADLRRLLEEPSLGQYCCSVLETQTLEEALSQCITSDLITTQRPDQTTEQRKSHQETRGREATREQPSPGLQWWRALVAGIPARRKTQVVEGDSTVTTDDNDKDGKEEERGNTTEEDRNVVFSADVFEEIISRFCGPYSRVPARTVAECVHLTGVAFGKSILRGDQLQVLKAENPFLFISGPPGSGKTLILGLKAAEWTVQGHQVVVLCSKGVNTGSLVSWTLYDRVLETVRQHKLKEAKRRSLSVSSEDEKSADKIKSQWQGRRRKSQSKRKAGTTGEKTIAESEESPRISVEDSSPASISTCSMSTSSLNDDPKGKENVLPGDCRADSQSSDKSSPGYSGRIDPGDITVDNLHREFITANTDMDSFVRQLLTKYKGRKLRIIVDECLNKFDEEFLFKKCSDAQDNLEQMKTLYDNIISLIKVPKKDALPCLHSEQEKITDGGKSRDVNLRKQRGGHSKQDVDKSERTEDKDSTNFTKLWTPEGYFPTMEFRKKKMDDRFQKLRGATSGGPPIMRSARWRSTQDLLCATFETVKELNTKAADGLRDLPASLSCDDTATLKRLDDLMVKVMGDLFLAFNSLNSLQLFQFFAVITASARDTNSSLKKNALPEAQNVTQSPFFSEQHFESASQKQSVSQSLSVSVQHDLPSGQNQSFEQSKGVSEADSVTRISHSSEQKCEAASENHSVSKATKMSEAQKPTCSQKQSRESSSESVTQATMVSEQVYLPASGSHDLEHTKSASELDSVPTCMGMAQEETDNHSVSVWAASIFQGDKPDGFERVTLTDCIRCPPTVQRILQWTETNVTLSGEYKYITRGCDVNPPLPSDGPPVTWLDHAPHMTSYREVNDCPLCGEALADYLLNTLGIRTSADEKREKVKKRNVEDMQSQLYFHDVIICGSPIHQPDCAFVKELRAGGITLQYESQDLTGPPPYIDKAFVVGGGTVQGLEAKIVVFVPEIKRITEKEWQTSSAIPCNKSARTTSRPEGSDHGQCQDGNKQHGLCQGNSRPQGQAQSQAQGETQGQDGSQVHDQKHGNDESQGHCQRQEQEEKQVPNNDKQMAVSAETGYVSNLAEAGVYMSVGNARDVIEQDRLRDLGAWNRQYIWNVASRTVSHLVIIHV